MNCSDFQNQLHEYVERSLSADGQAAAKAHLAGCGACMQAVRQEQQVVQFLSAHLRQETKALALSPDIRNRILASLKAGSSPQTIVSLWTRFAWPLGIAASLLLAAMLLPTKHFTDTGAASAVSIEDSYRVPIHKFRQEGNLVLDTISYETVVVSETLWTTKLIREKQERKTPL
jgi:anti-sigma factor RsiW